MRHSPLKLSLHYDSQTFITRNVEESSQKKFPPKGRYLILHLKRIAFSDKSLPKGNFRILWTRKIGESSIRSNLTHSKSVELSFFIKSWDMIKCLIPLLNVEGWRCSLGQSPRVSWMAGTCKWYKTLVLTLTDSEILKVSGQIQNLILRRHILFWIEKSCLKRVSTLRF